MTEKKYKINYIIASYNCAQGKRTYSHPEDTLKINIRQLKELENDVTQITLMKAANGDKSKYEDYYFSPEEEAFLNLQTFEVENQGYSNGQWLRGYERRTQEYDYYIFSEDDYCPGFHNFDRVLLELYQKKFENNIGVLANLIQGAPKHPMELPLHYEGLVMVSRETMEQLYSRHNNPKQFLSYTRPPFVRIMPGGREQVNFITIFRLAEVPLSDTMPDAPFLYWNDCKADEYGGEIFCFEKPDDYSHVVNKFYYSSNFVFKPSLYICIPIQFARTCVLVAGMHRSGTSVFSGCLNLAGIDYGRNKAQVSDSFNETGYFENMTFLHFNEETLSKIASHWHDTSPLCSAQVDKMLEQRERLMAVVRSEFSSNNFFIKDPRISLLLPLYLAALKSLCIKPVIVFLDRNNGSIARSLNRAQGVAPSKGMALCHKYKNCLYKNRGSTPIIKYKFDFFIENPVRCINKILRYYERGDVVSPARANDINTFVNKKQIHF